MNANASVEVMTMNKACTSFPSVPKKEIVRSNILTSIERKVTNNDLKEIILIEGIEGIGKTVLMRQFAERNDKNTVSLFLIPSSSFGLDLQIIRYDLANQLEWFLYNKEIKNHDLNEITDSYLKTQIFKAQRKAVSENTFIYFVIDGLDDIPDNHRMVRDILYNELPLGQNKFKFLFTCKSTKSLTEVFQSRKLEVSTLTIDGLTTDDITRYFASYQLNSQEIDELEMISQGVPSIMTTIDSVLKTGKKVTDLPVEFKDLFKLVWEQVDEDDYVLLRFLLVVANDNNTYSASTLAEVLQVEEIKLNNYIILLSFIELNEGRIYFVSEGFRLFVKNKLSDIETIVDEMLIDYYSQQPQSVESLKKLPEYYLKRNQYNELIAYLTTENIEKVLINSETLSSVKQLSDMGLNASKTVNNNEGLFKFALQSAYINESMITSIWNSEIEARIALNEYEGALTLANSANLIEDRFEMLVLIAKHQTQDGLQPEMELIDQIKTLFNRIQYQDLGDRAVIIATNLMYFDPEMAIELVENSTISGNDGDTDNSLDVALATLSITAQETDDVYEKHNTLEKINSKIKNKKVQFFSTQVATRFNKFSSEDILKETKRLEKDSDKLFLLGIWTARNEKLDGAYEVISYALDLIIKDLETSPNAKLFRDLCKQIHHLEEDQIKDILERIIAQIDNIERLGPTDDYIGLQLLLSQAEKIVGREEHEERLINLYFYISDIKDISVSTAGMANFFSMLKKIDIDMTLESKEGLHTLVEETLNENIDILLINTADHYEMFIPVIKALSKENNGMVIEIINKLNTQGAREHALYEMIKTYSDQPLDILDPALFLSVYRSIENLEIKDDMILLVVNKIQKQSKSTDMIDLELLKGYFPMIDQINTMFNAEKKCETLSILFPILMRYEQQKTWGKKFLQELEYTWESIDVGWTKVDLGFEIVRQLSETSIENSRSFLRKTENFRDEINFSDPQLSLAYLVSLKLLIRSTKGLLPKKLLTEDHIDKIGALVDLIPSYGEQILIWSDFALSLIKYDDSRYREIVNNKIKKLLEALSEIDKSYKFKILSYIAPALYISHERTAFELLQELDSITFDAAIHNIIDFILTKTIPGDPYKNVAGTGYSVTYENVVDICSLIKRMENDSRIYECIKEVSNCFQSKESERNISKVQKTDIVNKLYEIIEDKLPSTKNIKHDGYKILAKSEVLRMDKGNNQDWDQLKISTDQIDNYSDRAFTISILAHNLPNKLETKFKSFIEEAEELVDNIPIVYEKMSRFESIGGTLLHKNKLLSRKFLKRGMEVSLEKNYEKSYPVQRSIIDIAHQIDPTFASSLIALTDDDPSKNRNKRKLTKNVEMLDLHHEIINKKNNHENVEFEPDKLVQATWKLLGELNANRIQTIAVDDVREYIIKGSKLPISMAYPILSWVIENHSIRHQNTPDALKILLPMFESLLTSIRTILVMSGKNVSQIKIINQSLKDTSQKRHFIKIGKGRDAQDFVRTWFEKNLDEYLIICDPYFGLQELEVLNWALSNEKLKNVSILTSVEHNKDLGFQVESEFRTYWNKLFSPQLPPTTNIYLLGDQNGQIPIHDRWCVTKGTGLRIGTSFNSFGNKESEISEMTKEETIETENRLRMYIENRTKKIGTKNLTRFVFEL